MIRLLNQPRITSTELSGRWLVALRITWITLVTLGVVVFIAGMAVQVSEPRPSCTGEGSACNDFNFSLEDIAVARDMGLPAGVLASGADFAGLALGLAYMLVGGFLFWRKSSDWLVSLVSLTLVLIGASLVSPGTYRLTTSYPEWDPLQTGLGTVGVLAFVLLLSIHDPGGIEPHLAESEGGCREPSW